MNRRFKIVLWCYGATMLNCPLCSSLLHGLEYQWTESHNHMSFRLLVFGRNRSLPSTKVALSQCSCLKDLRVKCKVIFFLLKPWSATNHLKHTHTHTPTRDWTPLKQFNFHLTNKFILFFLILFLTPLK